VKCQPTETEAVRAFLNWLEPIWDGLWPIIKATVAKQLVSYGQPDRFARESFEIQLVPMGNEDWSDGFWGAELLFEKGDGFWGVYFQDSEMYREQPSF
jgi:hypothetical protein